MPEWEIFWNANGCMMRSEVSAVTEASVMKAHKRWGRDAELLLQIAVFRLQIIDSSLQIHGAPVVPMCVSPHSDFFV